MSCDAHLPNPPRLLCDFEGNMLEEAAHRNVESIHTLFEKLRIVALERTRIDPRDPTIFGYKRGHSNPTVHNLQSFTFCELLLDI